MVRFKIKRDPQKEPKCVHQFISFSDCTPESIFSSKAEHQVDIQRKLQEDPLIALRKTEVDTRKRILDNPLKMREIQAYIEKSKKKKSKKKKKKHSKSDSEDEDLDALLMKKLNKLRKEDSDDSDKVEQERKPKKERNPERNRSRSKSRDRSRPSSSKHDRRRSRSREQHRPRRSRSRDRPRRSRSRDRPRRSRSRDRRDRSRSTDCKNDFRRKSRSPPPQKFQKPSYKKETKSKLSDEEKEKKLREMMSNASWREDQRTKKVQQYRDADQKEESAHYSRDHDPEFVTKQLMKAAESGSVAKRIQSNKHNIQRSSMAMDKNFARK